MIPCVFFDRDGIVNRAPPEGGYVERWTDFHVQPEFVAALRVARERGHAAVIVTNQRCVALGLITEVELEDMHRRLRTLLRDGHQLELLDILYCPHDRGACLCRKPLPGMLLEATRRHDIDLGQSWMVGDSEKDVLAGRAAGCRTILVTDTDRPTVADVHLRHMSDLRSELEKRLPPR